MSKLESLTQKILDDANAKAIVINEEAQKKSRAVLSMRVKEANDRKEKILERAHAEAAMIKDRVVSSAKLKVRDEKLSAKQEIMEKVFELSKDELLNLDDEVLLSFMKNSISSIGAKGKAVLIMPAGKKGLAGSLGLDIEVKEDDMVKTGFILKDEDIIYNYTFDSLVDEIRDEIEGEIAAELFKGLE